MPDALEASISDELPDPGGPTGSVALVQRAQKGDSEALERLLERYQERLRRIVRVRLGAHMREHLESMDIVQEAYQVAWRRVGDFELRGPGSVLHWLSKIAENKIRDARDYIYAAKRDPNMESPLEAPGASTSDEDGAARLRASTTLPDERAARAEIKEIVDGALAELDETHREVIVLRDYCGGEWDEVAKLLERSVGAAQELHRRAWIKLRRIVRPRLGEL